MCGYSAKTVDSYEQLQREIYRCKARDDNKFYCTIYLNRLEQIYLQDQIAALPPNYEACFQRIQQCVVGSRSDQTKVSFGWSFKE